MKKVFLFFAIILFFSFSHAEDASGDKISIDGGAFKSWLDEFYKRAIEKGIKKSTLDSALAGVQPVVAAIELDRKQPEKVITFEEYMKRVVPNSRIERGKRLLKQNARILDEVSKKYQVPPEYIVALWGIETDYGNNTGNFYVLDVLATLAFDNRRGDFFEEELINALRIIEQGNINAHNMKGSWAGAMGQTQFMPSSFIKYAVDYDGDGRKDIWGSKSDIFASIANYLSKSGWKMDKSWGAQVNIPDNFDVNLASVKIEKPIAEWEKLGVKAENGVSAPGNEADVSVIIPGGDKNDAFFVYSNYKTILKWNRSLYFASAVVKLADTIRE